MSLSKLDLFILTDALLVLDQPAQVWWRWMNIFLTLVIWTVELVVTDDDESIGDKWKVE